MQTLTMLLRRFRVQAYMDLMWLTRDFRLCMTHIVCDTIVSLASVTGVFLLAARFDGIGAWSREQILFFLGYAALVRGVLDVFFGFNVLMISRRIGRGQFDHVLVQPQPMWMVLLTEGFIPFSGCWPALAGAGITGWALWQIGLPATALWWPWLAVQLLSSCAVMLGFSFLWGSLAFWSPVGAEEVSSSATRFISGLKPFPLDGLGPLAQGVLLSALPVGFVAWVPCRALLGIGGAELWTTPAAAVGVCGLAWWAFKRGVRHYGQTGSQRYSGGGHRN